MELIKNQSQFLFLFLTKYENFIQLHKKDKDDKIKS